MVCGLNGAGKSTLGRALAEKLGFRFIDSEDLYFPKTDPGYAYAAPRSREEAEKRLFQEIKTHENFVFAAVKGDFWEKIGLCFRCAVLVQAPKDVRMRRIRERSFRKFGKRILPGGDLYEAEEDFFRRAEGRPENMVEEWVRSLGCPVMRVDGTKPVEENIRFVTERLGSQIKGL